jgi:hypothetical protein
VANPNPLGGAGGPGHTAGVPFTTTNSPSRVRWKWELAIRFQLKNPNAKQTEVAQHIGIDVVTLSQWQSDPEWINLHNQIVTGILGAVDAELAEDITHQRLTLKRLVPTALQNLAELALQSANPNIKLKATTEILDRDGHFAKVQRVGLASEAQGGVSDEKDNDIATALIAALANAKTNTSTSQGEEGKVAGAPPTIDSAPASKEVQ